MTISKQFADNPTARLVERNTTAMTVAEMGISQSSTSGLLEVTFWNVKFASSDVVCAKVDAIIFKEPEVLTL